MKNKQKWGNTAARALALVLAAVVIGFTILLFTAIAFM